MQLGALGKRFLHAVVAKFDGSGRDQRPDDGLVILRIAGWQGLCARREFFEELVCDLSLDDDTPRVEANLALMEEGAKSRGATA
jgi:hypothetical protein